MMTEMKVGTAASLHLVLAVYTSLADIETVVSRMMQIARKVPMLVHMKFIGQT